MATNASIAMKTPEGTYVGIYCHWDGYIQHGVGDMLLKNYTTPEDVAKLIEIGDISSLGENLNETVYYHRDRGEAYKDVKPLVAETYPLLMKALRHEYNYLYEDGQWKETSLNLSLEQ